MIFPPAPSKFGDKFVKDFYKNKQITDKSFVLKCIKEKDTLDMLNKFYTTKAAGIDGLSRRFLKDGSAIIAKPITQLINLSIELATVPDSCKIKATF